VAKGLDAVIVNPGSIKGPYGAQYRGAEIVRTVRRTPVVPYFTGGICVVHVEDVVIGIIAALERGITGQRYILGGENLTFKALGQRAARALNLQRRFVPLPAVVTGLVALALKPWSQLKSQPPWITYATHYCASRYQFYDSSRALKVLGYQPRDFDAILLECLSLTDLSIK
jgi:nucleoside-diphosphate-sugar epimerase